MFTAQDFSSVEEFLLYESRDLTNTPEIILLEDNSNKILVETSVEFMIADASYFHILTEEGDYIIEETYVRMTMEDDDYILT